MRISEREFTPPFCVSATPLSTGRGDPQTTLYEVCSVNVRPEGFLYIAAGSGKPIRLNSARSGGLKQRNTA